MRVFFLFIFLFCSQLLVSQDKYWVYFKDKNNVEFNPFEFFSQNAIERRLKHKVDLNNPSDWPVNENYQKTVAEIAQRHSYSSRWLNAMVVWADAAQIKCIQQLSFVDRVESTLIFKKQFCEISQDTISEKNLVLARKQVNRFRPKWFRQHKMDGTGIRIAVLDGGFTGADEHPALKHVFDDNRIIATKDFATRRKSVYHSSTHGSSVLSCIAGIIEDTIEMGLAPKAEFLLARTEKIIGESFAEEENWIAAIEWADKLGAHIISSSLGYTAQRYFPEDMDGKTTAISKAANIAFEKGLLIISSAGNEGQKSNWRIISAPADAQNVLAVGGIDPASDVHINFSSVGPTMDGRLKPNVSAYGSAIVIGKKGYHEAQGTSFACPLVAGFAACAMQKKPTFTNKQIFDAIQYSADLYPFYDFAHGYGVPQSDYFYPKTNSDSEPKVPFRVNLAEELSDAKFKIEIDSLYKDDLFTENFFFHIFDKEGNSLRYGVILPEKLTFDSKIFRPRNPKSFMGYMYSAGTFKEGDRAMLHFKGYTTNFVIPNQTASD